MSDGKIALTAADGQAVEVDLPTVPYRAAVGLPFTLSRLDNRAYAVGDLGARYDKYTCRCDLVVDEAQAWSLHVFLGAHRRESFTLTVDPTSGFDPFTPLRGNAGPFQVSARLTRRRGMLLEPHRYFGHELTLTHVGSWPAYALPEAPEQGSLTVAGVTGIDFPETYFEPELEYANEVTHSEGSTPYYLDRGNQADAAVTNFSLRLNRGKCAALLAALVGTYRAEPFTISMAVGQFAFGVEHGDARDYVVRLVQDLLEVEARDVDDYHLRLRVQMVDTSIGTWQDTDGATVGYQDTDGATLAIQDLG